MTLTDLIPTLRPTCYARLERGLWPASATASCDGELTVGGVDVTELAGRFGTPLYLLDTGEVRSAAHAYRAALPGAEIAYAGKALLTKGVARLLAREGLSLDVCSGGEVALAVAAGVSPERMLLHGNVKTPEELEYALQVGVGRIVVDSLDDIDQLGDLARHPQKVLVRVTPDVDGHTHPSLATGVEDQKFGVPISPAAAARRVLAHPTLQLVGLHCHLGSQIRDVRAYELAATRVIAMAAQLKRESGVEIEQLDLGGGHAVAHTEGEQAFDLAGFARRVSAAISRACAEHRVRLPKLIIEPGRALVARAGITVYRVATLKRLANGRTFVAVDGGMSDNPRPALYGARYTARLVGRPCTVACETVTVVGRHCEAGDVLGEVVLPSDVRAGDLLAVPVTGAYHHSMASTYNIVGRPPLIGVEDGLISPLVRRENIEDLLARDLG